MVPRKRKDRQRPEGVRIVYADLKPEEVRGMATAPVRTVMDCASRMPFDEALAIADSALRARDATKRELLQAAECMPGRYRMRCLRVAREADGRADNPFESVLRAIAAWCVSSPDDPPDRHPDRRHEDSPPKSRADAG